MNSSTTEGFRREFALLPREIQELAKKNYRLWRQNSRHPSLQFKKVGSYWSIRVGEHYRALGRLKGDTLYWFRIGSHADYDRWPKH